MAGPLLACYFFLSPLCLLSKLNGPNLFSSFSDRNLSWPVIISIDLLLEPCCPRCVCLRRSDQSCEFFLIRARRFYETLSDL